MDGTSPAAPRVVLQDGQRRRWLCFGEPIRVLRAESTDQVLAALYEAEQAVEAEGLYAAGLVAAGTNRPRGRCHDAGFIQPPRPCPWPCPMA